MDWTDIVLPSDLHADLTVATKEHNITQVRQLIDTLEGLGTKGQSLAAHLHELSRKYDMAAIKTVLEKIKCEG